MDDEPTCDLVLPCLDEGPALEDLLPRVPAAYRVIVVDNDSSDDTAAVARRHGATVVVERKRGYGAAVHAGLEAATAEPGARWPRRRRRRAARHRSAPGPSTPDGRRPHLRAVPWCVVGADAVPDLAADVGYSSSTREIGTRWVAVLKTGGAG